VDGVEDAVDVEVSSEVVDEEEEELARRASKADDSPHALVSIGDDARAKRLDTSAAIE